MIKDFLTKVRRRRRVIDADAVLVAFPRCGLPRLRDLLWNFLVIQFDLKGARAGNLLDLWGQAKGRVPKLFTTNDEDPHTKFPDEINQDKAIYEGKKAVLLVRDPRNVIASLYYRRSRRGYIDSNYYWGTLTDFIREGEGGFETLLKFYSVWTSPANVSVHLVSYENLHDDPAAELLKVVDFLGISGVGEESLIRAVRQTPAFGDDNSARAVPRKSAYLEPEVPEGEGSDEKFKHPYLREFEDEDLDWLREQMDEMLPGVFPFYRKEDDPEVENKEA